jgi:hypothetical protein
MRQIDSGKSKCESSVMSPDQPLAGSTADALTTVIDRRTELHEEIADLQKMAF